MAGPGGITLNAGTGGAALGIDADASFNYQIVKLGYSASGTTPTQVSTAAPLPVTLANTGANGTAIKVDGSAVTQPVSGTVTANLGTVSGIALDTSVNGILLSQGATTSGEKGPLIQGAVTTAAPTYTTAQTSPLSMDTSGNLRVTVSNGIAAGTAGSANANVLSIQGIASMTPVSVSQGLATSGGASYNNAIAPATPAVTTVKSSAGNVYGIVAFNLLATPVYLKFFDATSVTLGTTAANFQFMVPGNTGGAGFVIQLPVPRSCATAIKYAVTGGIATTDNTSITASSVIVDVAYN